MQFINKAFNWLILSSADSTNLSATLKGSLVFTLITALASALHINGITDVANNSVSVIVAGGQFVSAVYALFGALRKVKRTVGGTNAVLKDPTL